MIKPIKKTGMEYIFTVLRYVYNVSDVFDRKEFEEKLTHAIGDEKTESIMTIADQLRMEGIIEGKIEGEMEGEVKGKIKTFKELMELGLLAQDFAEKKIAELIKELARLHSRNPGENLPTY